MILIGLLIGGLILGSLMLAAGLFFWLRGSNTAPETTIEMPAVTDPAQMETRPLGDFTFPVFPGATTPEPTLVDSMGVPPDGVGLVAANTSVAEVTAWYQTTLPAQGYSQVEINAGVINAISPTGQPLVVNTWDTTGGGQIGVIAAVVSAPPAAAEPSAPAQPMAETAPAEPPAPPAEAQPLPTAPPTGEVMEGAGVDSAASQMAAPPLPEILPAEGEIVLPEPPAEESAPPMAESAPAEGAVAPAALPEGEVLPLSISATVSPTTIYAGTFNRLSYTLVVTGSGLVTITANLPDGVLVHPDAFSAPGNHAYNPATHSWRWQPDLSTAAGGVLTAEFEAVNDLLHPPDSLVLKIVAQTSDPTQQPLIQAVTLEAEKY